MWGSTLFGFVKKPSKPIGTVTREVQTFFADIRSTSGYLSEELIHVRRQEAKREASDEHGE